MIDAANLTMSILGDGAQGENSFPAANGELYEGYNKAAWASN